MINNKLSHLEIELLEKTREFVSNLNNKNPEKNNQYRKAYFIRQGENPKRNKIKIKIMQHHLLKNLSDGNLQKAFIGRAIAQNSPIVILDEPTAHLDEENKIMILKLLRNLAIQQNKLIIFSSHDWRLAKEFSDTIWLVKNQSIYAGITEDILSQFDELAKPQLFQFSEKFVAPTIKAPQFEAEILYSFLQKKYQKDLSSLNFEFKDNIWVITDGKNQHFAQNFEEIHQIIVKNG